MRTRDSLDTEMSEIALVSTYRFLGKGANVMITGHSNKSVDVNALRLVREFLVEDESTEGIHHLLPTTLGPIYTYLISCLANMVII